MFVINPLSACAMVHEVLAVRPDTWLLQSAAGSALAKMVIRMSKVTGFRTINLIRSEAHRPALEALGAEIVINTESLDLRDEVARITGGRGVDYAMDCVGGDVAAQMLQCLTLGGHMVVFGTLGNTPITLPSRDMMMPVTSLSGFFAGSWLALQPPASIQGILGKVGQLAAKGVFDTPVDAVYPLTQVHEALAASQERGRLGKVMLKIGS
jgi:NADPH:quinone reductase-like Zn-dependent oxidoreductase